MVLSDSKKFIFIHVYKVAGTSISQELVKYSTQILPNIRAYRYLNRRFPMIFPLKYTRHATARQIRDAVGAEKYPTYFSFAFVRNPWDWVVSQYHYILRKKNHHQHQLITGFKDFDAYIDWLVSTKITTQKSILSDEKGNLIVNYVGKYENLDEDFANICEKIGIPRIELPKLNVTKKDSYKKYFNERTRDLIRQAYLADIEAFGYEF
jgi:hypothetical protein